VIINQWGTVVIGKDAIKIEGWKFQLEPSDNVKSPTNPEGPEPEQLLLAYTTNWALKSLKAELNKAAFDAIRNLRARN
jgi:hypothetical protein